VLEPSGIDHLEGLLELVPHAIDVQERGARRLSALHFAIQAVEIAAHDRVHIDPDGETFGARRNHEVNKLVLQKIAGITKGDVFGNGGMKRDAAISVAAGFLNARPNGILHSSFIVTRTTKPHYTDFALDSPLIGYISLYINGLRKSVTVEVFPAKTVA
jgi:hypothetical protein